jgi:hypothetical protein
MFESLIPLGASILGGLFSGSGKSSETTKKQELDPAMRPYIFDNPDALVPQAQKLFQRQTTDPSYTQGFADMRNRGRQLMGGSIAGNPFANGYTGGGLFGNAGSQYSYTPPVAPTPAAAPTAPQQPSIQELIAQMQAEQLRQYLMAEFASAGFGGADGSGGIGASGIGGGMSNNGEGGPDGVGGW